MKNMEKKLKDIRIIEFMKSENVVNSKLLKYIVYVLSKGDADFSTRSLMMSRPV